MSRGHMSDTKMLFHMVQGGPKPVAPFSHAVECDGWVFVTGQMPDTPANPGACRTGSKRRRATSWPTSPPS